ncbi:MAG: NYN domain-containing protein [Acidimicrobiia bacterium]
MEENRIALFLDYENLAIGARDALGGMTFDFKPIGDALAERGRVVVRRAYADWSYFDEDRRMLTRNHVELIEIPQRMGTSRKNAADIKLAVDALEMAFERGYLTTFVICTGDSDFTPLVHKLRELNKRVIGVGVKDSTSALLPPACDEFLFYDTLEGVDVPSEGRRTTRSRRKPAGEGAAKAESAAAGSAKQADQLAILVAQTVAGMQRGSAGEVLASSLKGALLRKDPTFSEADFGFRAFGELLRHLAERNVVELSKGPAKGDPEVSLPHKGGGETEALALLHSVVADLEQGKSPPVLSGLKYQVRKVRPDFSEKKYGYRSFLQFCKAAETRGLVSLNWDADTEDYVVAASPGG